MRVRARARARVRVRVRVRAVARGRVRAHLVARCEGSLVEERRLTQVRVSVRGGG